MPLCHTEACAPVGEVMEAPNPSSAASCAANGTRRRYASAPSSTAPSPANGVVLISPPIRSDDSRTVTCTDSSDVSSENALVRPEMPAPMTTTRRAWFTMQQPNVPKLPSQMRWN